MPATKKDRRQPTPVFQVPFSTLAIGARFLCSSEEHTGAFRKVSARHAFALRADGRGRTHARILFATQVNCLPIPEAKQAKPAAK